MLPETTYIERMIVGAVQKIAPEVLSRCWASLNSQDNGLEFNKRLILQTLMDERGPEVVMGLSEHIPDNALSSTLIYLLLNSSSPIELMEKVNRYDRYFHPTRRVELLQNGTDFVLVENVADTGDEPAAAEELFLCGTLRLMLERIGCKGVEVEWMSACSQELSQVLVEMGMQEPSHGQNTRWRYMWREYIHTGEIAGLDEFLSRYAEPFIMPKRMKVIDMVEKVMAIDLATKPSMEVVADMLGMSVRNFQRKLREEGTTYTRLFNELRIKVASRLLRQTNTSVTEVGFVSGFRDSAHFSREFKKVQQMSPKRYREIFKERRVQDDK